MIYLASPYSHHDPLVIRTRFLLAEQCTVRLMQQGEVVFSPIVHCHELAHKYDLPKDAKFWEKYDHSMLRLASALYILQIPGWEQSRGVTMERELAERAYIPVAFVNEEGEAWPA